MNALAREALRYLGARASDPNLPALLLLAEDCLNTLSAIPPRHVLRTMETAQVLREMGSQSLLAHLAGCERAVLFAATLGAEADALIRRAEVLEPLRAMALHAAAAAILESFSDRVQRETPGALRPRFSPGYGDFTLESQRPLLALLDAGRAIGLFLTEGGMLAPVKSITAVLGLGPAPTGCRASKCARCAMLTCTYRGDFACT